MSEPILSGRGLVRSFRTRRGDVHALAGVDVACEAGRTVGIVGESGCGKTTLTRLLLWLDRPTSGEVAFRGRDVAALSSSGLREMRRAVQPVFQNPYSSLNPRLRVGRIVGEPLAAATRLSRAEIARAVDQALERVGLPTEAARRVPAEFSGGQRQRIAIARAVAAGPELLILDEPVSSQDISIRAQILNLIKDLQAETGLAALFVSHDLATVRFMCDEVAVIYLGRIVERGPAANVCGAPDHPYTRSLKAATLTADPDAAPAEVPPLGELPSPLNPPSGCTYHPRCPFARDVCAAERPELLPTAEGAVACHMVHAESWE